MIFVLFKTVWYKVLLCDNFVYSVLPILLNFRSSGFLRQFVFLLSACKSERYFKIK